MQKKLNNITNRKIVSFLLFVVIVGGLYYSYYKLMKVYDYMYYTDSSTYTLPFLNFIKTGFFSSDNVNPEYLRTMGYPYFWYIFNQIGGDTFVIVVQNILFLLTDFLLLLVGDQLKCSRILVLSLVIFRILDVNTFHHNCAILTDGLFASVVFFATLAWIYYLKNGRTTNAFIVFSILLNYALALRPILLYFNLLLVIAMFVLVIIKTIKLRHFFIFVITFTLLCGSWIGRNYIQTGHAMYCPIGDRDMLIWYANYVQIEVSKENGVEPLNTEEFTSYEMARYYSNEELNSMDEIELFSAYSRVGRRYIGEHKKEYIKVLANNSLHIFFGVDDYIWKNAGISEKCIGIFKVIQRMLLITVYVIYINAIIKNYYKIDISDISIIVFLLYLYIASVNIGFIRFRVPMIGIICLEIIWLQRKELPYKSLLERIICKHNEDTNI